MKLSHLAGAALFATLLAPPTLAQQTECGDTIFQRELNACAEQHLEAANATLETVYKTALARTKAIDVAAIADDMRAPGAETSLRRAQAAWIDYRESHCSLIASPSRGGSMEPMVISACKTDLAAARTRELQDMLDDFGG